MLRVCHVMHLANPADLSAKPPLEEGWRLGTNPVPSNKHREFGLIGPNPRQTLLANSLCDHSLSKRERSFRDCYDALNCCLNAEEMSLHTTERGTSQGELQPTLLLWKMALQGPSISNAACH